MRLVCHVMQPALSEQVSVRVDVMGSLIRVYWNGVLLWQVTDSVNPITHGTIAALCCSQKLGQWDDFQVLFDQSRTSGCNACPGLQRAPYLTQVHRSSAGQKETVEASSNGFSLSRCDDCFP